MFCCGPVFYEASHVLVDLGRTFVSRGKQQLGSGSGPRSPGSDVRTSCRHLEVLLMLDFKYSEGVRRTRTISDNQRREVLLEKCIYLFINLDYLMF